MKNLLTIVTDWKNMSKMRPRSIQQYLRVTCRHHCASVSHAITGQTKFSKQLQVHTSSHEEVLGYIQWLLYISILLTVLSRLLIPFSSWMIRRKELIRRKPTKLKCARSVFFSFSFFLITIIKILQSYESVSFQIRFVRRVMRSRHVILLCS